VAAEGRRLGTGTATPIVIMSPDYWPLPWYWRDDPKAGFYGQVTDTSEPIVLLRKDQEATMSTSFTSQYARRDEYTLRPGVQLVLYLRRS
jgi:predicted membrane-bound mannosyltransferase